MQAKVHPVVAFLSHFCQEIAFTSLSTGSNTWGLFRVIVLIRFLCTTGYISLGKEEVGLG